jgi:D-alanyl-D-alanine carboxypeptidase (penicillin-binding protein 5/6)
MMNRQAQAWGLKNTAFKNVTGLTEPGHHSSARDLVTIASHIIRDYPEFFPTTRSRNTSTTTSPSRTATCCCDVTRRSTA